MSDGIDKQFLQEIYQRMTDQEVIQVLKGDLPNLTTEAQGVIKEEIKRRNLDFDLSEVNEAPLETLEMPEKLAGCPVHEPGRRWLESSVLTLLNLFGEESTLTRKILTPESKHFPIRFDGSERAAFETLRIVAHQMEVPADRITLDFYDETLRRITEGNPGGLYWGRGENDRFEISTARKMLDEPEMMVAVLAHEIAHIKLLGENKLEENDEQMTDLATIFFCLGIFNANAAFQTFADAKYYGWSSLGYLTQMEWGYALSLFTYIRREVQPEWAAHLCKNVKADFLQGQRFISDNEYLIFQEDAEL